MKHLSSLAAVFLFASVSLVNASGQFDGEWAGDIVFPKMSERVCVLESAPFTAQVENNQFIGEGKDLSGATRVFEGEVNSDGKIKTWGRWLAFGFNDNEETHPTEVTGLFSADKFVGKLNWYDQDQRVCQGRIDLHRK